MKEADSPPPPPPPPGETAAPRDGAADSSGGDATSNGGTPSPSPSAADGPSTPGGPNQGAGAAALEGQIAKFKRLLAMSRQRLEENQVQLAEKNQLIERLTSDVESLRSAAAAAASSSARQSSLGSTARGGSSPSTGMMMMVPRRALVRIQQGSTTWVLFEYDDTGGLDMQQQGGEGGEAWRAFRSEEDMHSFLARVVTGEPIKVPPPSLTPAASDDIREEARASVSRISEEFRKYRVRAELSMRQKEAEIKQISSANMAQHQHRIEDSVDVEDLARQVRAQDDRIAALRAELAQQEARWRGMYEKIVKENEMLQGAGAETALAAQWRKRYESVVREKEDLASKLDLSASSSLPSSDHQRRSPTTATASGISGLPLSSTSTAEQKYLDVKEEYKLYRKKALEALREKDAIIAELGGGTPPPPGGVARRSSAPGGSHHGKGGAGGGGGGMQLDLQGDPRIQYLKNLVSKYLSTDAPEIRDPTERAICTVLRFSDEEIKAMKASRGSGSSGGVPALGGAQWALPVANLFGSSSSSVSSSS